jgi:hypothetical protein
MFIKISMAKKCYFLMALFFGWNISIMRAVDMRSLTDKIYPFVDKLQKVDISFLTGRVYAILDRFGSVADSILARGDLSPENQKLVEEVAAKLHLEHRDIKAKNAGFILRMWFGYESVLAIQELNRVYFNDDVLNEYPQDTRKFAIARGLSHHYDNRSWKWLLFSKVLLSYVKKFVISKAVQKEFIISKFKPDGELIVSGNDLAEYLTIGSKFRGILLGSIWDLLLAQYDQQQEMYTDATAVIVAGLNPAFGKDFLYQSTYPTTDTWPLYARAFNLFRRVVRPIYSLPIIRHHRMQHRYNSVLYETRIAQLDSLQDEWQRRHGNRCDETHGSTKDEEEHKNWHARYSS